MVPKKTETISKKEKVIAKKLVKTKGMECTKQTCGHIAPCAVLCENMTCDTLNNKAKPSNTKGLWPCPTKIICDKFSCNKVDCNLKEK